MLSQQALLESWCLSHMTKLVQSESKGQDRTTRLSGVCHVPQIVYEHHTASF